MLITELFEEINKIKSETSNTDLKIKKLPKIFYVEPTIEKYYVINIQVLGSERKVYSTNKVDAINYANETFDKMISDGIYDINEDLEILTISKILDFGEDSIAVDFKNTTFNI